MTTWPAIALVVAVALGGGQPAATPTPAPRPSIRGLASWYAYVAGQAAAGPKLRAALGDWRGRTVMVNGIPVRLSDHCQCMEGQSDERIIDLDKRTFELLAPASRGLLEVSVTW